MVLVGVIPTLGGILILWVGALAATDRLPRNGWAGIRTMTTLRDDETWYAAHRTGSRWLLASGGLALATGLLVLVLRPDDTEVVTILLIGGLACGGCAIVAGITGQRAARRVLAARSDR
ncbi:MAG: SdpI family protein [Actinobacteria bacterium]|nr:MAG: SdpI family protein [Actinomycetota bacterium]